jgi:putative transcriptional regulator
MDISLWNNKLPQKGDVLVAEPFTTDLNFDHAVILLCENNEDGAFGFILNKPSDCFLNDSLPEFEHINARLYIGGPVEQNTLHFIHRVGDQLRGSVSLGNDLYWGGDFEELRIMLTSGLADVKDFIFFLGYSGWDKEQLVEELKHNAWAVSKLDSDDIFMDKPSLLWKKTLLKLGGKYKIIANFPSNPRLN